MNYSNIDNYLITNKQFITVKIFYFHSCHVFNNFYDILECVRLLNSKILLQDPKNLLKYYYLGCSGLRKEGLDVSYAPLCLWHLAEEILDFYKINNIKIDICDFILKKNIKEIKNFYYRTIAKTIDDYRKIDPYEYKKK